jgi:hypothetical protein
MDTVGNTMESRIPAKKVTGFWGLFPYIRKRSRSDHQEKTVPTKNLTPQLVQKTEPSTPVPKKREPQQPGASPGTEAVKEEARIGNGSKNKDQLEEQGRYQNEQSENIGQPGASDGKKPTHQRRPKRDLWSEAWNSSKLVSVKELLESRWKDSYDNAPDEPSKPSVGAKNAKRSRIFQGAAESPAHEDASGRANSKIEHPNQVVGEVIHRTKKKIATYEDWWGSERSSTVAGKARDALLSALVVKELIDAGLAFDPTGYGACAWAVVSFGLKVRPTI